MTSAIPVKFQFCDSEDISDEELVQQGKKMEENTEEIGDAYCIALTGSMTRDKVFPLALFHVLVKNKSTLFFWAFYFYVTFIMVHKRADRGKTESTKLFFYKMF